MYIYQAHHAPAVFIHQSLPLGGRDQGELCFEPHQRQKVQVIKSEVKFLIIE